MNTWILEPRDPLIARDGRPFTAAPGARATTLPFPFPSTLAGAARTKAGRNPDGVFDTSLIPTVKQYSVCGPLLAELNEKDIITDWFAPAPADALLLEAGTKEEGFLKLLKPIGRKQGIAPLPYDWLPIGMSDTAERRKPHSAAPRFWCWAEFKQWLIAPREQTIVLSKLGLTGLPQQTRTHVKVEKDTQTSEEGALFQTRGLEFTHLQNKEKLSQARRLALALATDANLSADGFDSLGGERRMAMWRAGAMAQGMENLFTESCPQEVAATIQDGEWHCRLLLLTPSYFKLGLKPEWLCLPRQDAPGVSVEIKAIASQRYQVVSGWDFEINKAKPTRRLTPAGAVFFLCLKGRKDKIVDWVKQTWMRCVSDNDEHGADTYRKDGFGLAVLGNWDGRVEDLKYVKKHSER